MNRTERTGQRWPLALAAAALPLAVGAAVRSYAADLFEVPAEPQPCARCRTAQRAASGWCEPCAELLRANPARTGHPVFRYLAADDRRDVRALTSCVATRATTQLPWGDRADSSRREFGWNARVSYWCFGRERSSTNLAVLVDPVSPAFVWVHSRERAVGLPGLGRLAGELLTRLRFDAEGLIDEVVTYPALPQTGPAAVHG